jgi:hypothetical protein
VLAVIAAMWATSDGVSAAAAERGGAVAALRAACGGWVVGWLLIVLCNVEDIAAARG